MDRASLWSVQFVLVSACGCIHRLPDENAPSVGVEGSVVRIDAATRLPTSFPKQLSGFELRRDMVIPAGAVWVSEVVRPRAELRAGPGVQFELAERIVDRGTKLVVFETHGVWRHVVSASDSEVRGWVHGAILSDPVLNGANWRVAESALPTVVAARDIGSAQSFPRHEILDVTVPRGALFTALSFSMTHVLVVLPETQSLLWLQRKDVR